MKAAVCREFGKPLVIEDVELAAPETGELRVRMKAVGICQSDIHSLDGAWSGKLPAVYGHEAAGIVDEVGPGVSDFQVGQHVVVTLIRACHRCFFCTMGQPALCETTFHLDRESPLKDRTGAPITQALKMAAFAESVVVDASQAVVIPDTVPFEPASLVACAVLTGYGAVVNTAAVEPGSAVVIIGTGGVGLNAVQGAALSGARLVIAVDVADDKLEAARKFGATHTINPKREDVSKGVADLTVGRGADYVFVTVGSAAAVEQAIGLMRRAGTLVLVGMPPSGAISRVDATQVAHDGQRILGSKMGSARNGPDVRALIGLYQKGELKLDELVTNRYPLTRINEAIESTKRGEALRNVIVF
jgi:S-(hydroxymethyl)glutathione dehydrogenase / alcohol dehydrogenase